MAFPYPAYDYPYATTKEECEASGSTWVDNSGFAGYCQLSKEQQAENDRKFTEASNTHALFYGGSIILISIAAISASLFYIKNKAIANGFLGGGIVTLFSTSFLTNVGIISMAILLLVLLFIAIKKVPKN